MRVLPPKNLKKYEGKKATKRMIISYIGNHRLLFSDGAETTVGRYLKSCIGFTHREKALFLTMFPKELQGMAKIYLEHFYRVKHEP